MNEPLSETRKDRLLKSWQGVRSFITRSANVVMAQVRSGAAFRQLGHGLRQPIVVTTVITLGLVLGTRQLGWLEAGEVATYDQMVRLRRPLPPDPRMLVVGITEADIQTHGWPIPDAILAQLLATLQAQQARLIGLDILRDNPQDAAFIHQLQLDNVIVITSLGDLATTQVPPPPGVDPEQIGFNDVVVDTDNVVRRNLLFGTVDDDQTMYSLSLRLAQAYLSQEGLLPTPADSRGRFQWGQAHFQPLQPHSGGYRHADAAGYQLLLNYRNYKQGARLVSLGEVLAGEVDPSWIADKIVLIGTTAPSGKDLFPTPYSATEAGDFMIPGVMIHAQQASQIMAAVLGERPLFWFWPEWLEVVWISAWSIGGAILAYRVRHPLHLGGLFLVGLGLITGIGMGSFLLGGWIPVVTPAIAWVATGGGVMACVTYQLYQEQQRLAKLVQVRDDELLLMQTVLEEHTGLVDRPVSLILRDSHTQPLLADRYQITQLLGTGGFGQTYLAEDTHRPGKPICVVKRLLLAQKNPRHMEIARRLFKAEAEILETLGKQKYIPQLLAYFEDEAENDFYLVEEFIEGQSLCDLLPADKRQPEDWVLTWLKGMLEILVPIHAAHVIHRDIKPSNVIIRKRDQHPVLIDFGAVKQLNPYANEDEEALTVAIGTRGYAPPEQLLGSPNLSSDLYATGMICIQALTGIPPTKLPRDEDSGELNWRPLAKVTPEFGAIIDKMTWYFFTDRYRSAMEVLQDLKQLTDNR
ncbi:CHASE2 domain-containing protein [Trichothermofontia sp.]